MQYTVKPVKKGHQRERPKMAFIDQWALFGGYFVLFDQQRGIRGKDRNGLYRPVGFIWGLLCSI
jgi:hypothetical protein